MDVPRAARSQWLHPIALALLCTALATSAAIAQEKRTITGIVVDALTQRPLFGAMVSLRDQKWAVLTDTLGIFRLPNVPAGPIELEIENMGYVPLLVHQDSDELSGVVKLALQPRPVVLKGIEVWGDAFRRRRNATATSVRAFGTRDLQYAAARDALEFIESRTSLRQVPCPGSVGSFDCGLVRGRPRRVSVYIDEMPTFGGLDHLRGYQPYELYAIEVYGGGSHVRVYTKWFVESAAERGWTPAPILIW